ncbi:SDR family oxidoreductase [Phormidium sp. FACHB-592]|uniref:SDR family oxidoreductase n=1 Tax=Stenomitos frigidus AS-A4 TaxID=2933935 RepID=A0ABV0KSV3_9CYAN|nr:SDR family oxidoreductase [Phormidium sp. FACHB-592]MBD2073071.1 SDR family oxidoreductase [Phormidium sp. FACHB-592]
MFLVTGATGDLGRRIVRSLREREMPVRSFVRLNARYSELENRGSDIFIGDLQRERDLQKACQGVQYVISAHGSGETSNGDAETIDYQATIELIEQAKAAGVQHFVFISVLGVDRGYEDAPVFKAKREAEKHLQASGLNYTILRPSGFASNLLPLAEQFRRTGVYVLIGDPLSRTSIVSTDDLARLAIESVSTEGARNQIFPVGGPDILKREDIPQIFGRLFNREPFLLNPPLLAVDGVRSAIGLFNPKLRSSLGTLRTLLANEFFTTPAETAHLESTFNFKLESLEAFLRRYLGV